MAKTRCLACKLLNTQAEALKHISYDSVSNMTKVASQIPTAETGREGIILFVETLCEGHKERFLDEENFNAMLRQYNETLLSLQRKVGIAR